MEYQIVAQSYGNTGGNVMMAEVAIKDPMDGEISYIRTDGDTTVVSKYSIFGEHDIQAEDETVMNMPPPDARLYRAFRIAHNLYNRYTKVIS